MIRRLTVCVVFSNLITSSADYKHAFELAGNSPYLGMKMCIGCWLEGGENFGNVLEDIKYFVENKKVLCVHFRNVSSPMPQFEETLLEDGYMNMYEIMKAFVKADYDGVLTCRPCSAMGNWCWNWWFYNSMDLQYGIHQGAVEMCNGRGKQII